MSATVGPEMEVSAAREPMRVVEFPHHLRNDIFYCQKAMKEHIKIHQFCAVQYALRPTRRYAKVIQKIEDEIQAISVDQQKVMRLMKQHLRGLHGKLLVNGQHGPATANSGDDYDNQIIRAYLDMNRPSMAGLTLRASDCINSRATEKELIREYDLLADLQAFMRPKTVLERLPLSPLKGRPAVQQNVNESRRKFLAALKAVNPRPDKGLKRPNSDDEDEERFLQDVRPLFPISDGLEDQDSKDGDLVLGKRGRGRPRKKKLLNGQASVPTTRTNSPEVVTMPWVDLPDEPEETNDLDQAGFLQRFGLLTHAAYTQMKNRRPVRRRRNVQGTEKTDFHYGHLDLNNTRTSTLIKAARKPQYLTPRTFKKVRSFDRSASSSPPSFEEKRRASP